MIQQNKKLVLGTVQLGMKYGLNNTHGQPTKEESFRILDKALASGINTFDTAWAYGEAEDVLGAWIKERNLAGKIKIISKMKPHALNDYPDGTKAVDIVEMEVEKSLKRLGVKSLDGYLLHSPHYVYMNYIMEGLQKIKEKGLVKNIGVSIYDEPEALQAASLGVDYIQIPYNAFDQRLDSTDFFDVAKKNKVTVFARAPFLQGLLLMQPQNLPAHLAFIAPHLEKFISICKKYNLSQGEASLAFSLENCRADYIVFGVETSEQLEQDIGVIKDLSKIPAGFIDEVKKSFRELNRGAINPSLWNKTKKKG